METGGSGILGRLGERILSWIALGLLIAAGIAIWQMEPATRSAIWNAIWRTIAWLVIVAMVPWSGRFFMRRILEIGSNWAGAALVAAFVVVDVLAAMILMTGWPSGGWAWLASLAALGVAGTYNYLVAEYLADQGGL